MATFAFNIMVLAHGTTFVFGSWVCVGNGSGGLNGHLNNPTEPEAISSESCDFADGSSNLGEMLLPDLAKEIEQKLDTNSSSTRTQISLSPSSTQVETFCIQPTFGLRNSASTYQEMIKSIYSTYGASSDYPVYVKNSHATASREAPVFDVYSNSDESPSDDNLDVIIDALAQLQTEPCCGRGPQWSRARRTTRSLTRS
jgi:hypothetical protein